MDEAIGRAAAASTAGHQVWYLNDGEELTFGRDGDIPLGTAPEDDEIARTSGALSYASGSVWVRSASRNTLYVRRQSGPDLVLDRPGMRICPSERSFRVLIRGRVYDYAIEVRLPDGPGERPTVSVPHSKLPVPKEAVPKETINWRKVLSPAELNMLAALCYFLITRSGPEARPATYEQAGLLLGLNPRTLRLHVGKLRQRLGNLGVPHMEETGDPDAAQAKDELALYAWRNGIVSEDDVVDLPVPSEWP